MCIMRSLVRDVFVVCLRAAHPDTSVRANSRRRPTSLCIRVPCAHDLHIVLSNVLEYNVSRLPYKLCDERCQYAFSAHIYAVSNMRSPRYPDTRAADTREMGPRSASCMLRGHGDGSLCFLCQKVMCYYLFGTYRATRATLQVEHSANSISPVREQSGIPVSLRTGLVARVQFLAPPAARDGILSLIHDPPGRSVECSSHR